MPASLEEAPSAFPRLSQGLNLRPVDRIDQAAFTLEGINGGVFDLTGVELRGQGAGARIDTALGYGILVRRCHGITIRGGVLGGYKGCIVLEDSSDVTIEGVRFDGWYGQRLKSTEFAGDPTDSLSPHENDRGEWLENYGAAISATNCRGLRVHSCRGRRGQNGVLLTRSQDCEVYDNDFSFLSGWGVGMYRSSECVVAHNVLDYCVRGYSHGRYWQAQRAAGILMLDGCSKNLVVRNSATHCGDGVFVHGGQGIIKDASATAAGCDQNIFAENDLRFSAASSVEIALSDRNAVLRNDLRGAHQHGVLGSYASRMIVLGNRIEQVVGGGVTIAHGQECLIADNAIARNEIGLALYWDEDPEFAAGPYSRVKDVRSRDHFVLENSFEDNVVDLALQRSTGLTFHGNEYVPGTRAPYLADLTCEGDESFDQGTVKRWLDAPLGAIPSGNVSEVSMRPWVGSPPDMLAVWRGYSLPPFPGAQEIRAEERDEFRGGLETILLGEWGPWDFRSGAPRPPRRKPGGLLVDSVWDAQWFQWELEGSDPRTREAAWRQRASRPDAVARVTTFTNPWSSDEVRRVVGAEFFGLIANSTFTCDRSTRASYVLQVRSDDGVRILIDGRPVLEDWTLHEARRGEQLVELEPGEHSIRLEYFQVQGSAALSIDLSPR
ncbi:MAG: right-handed parallel beta-helix repeat-containing protein [Planctomycetota bacterium]|nr:right-handed parallel beta-helix repeat-containing protein [Planctomycetota bacterium]